MRVASLTGLRGLAAVAVLLYHVPQQAAFAGFAMPLFARAYLAVDLFFILSGFVISVGYYEKVGRHWSLPAYGDFLVNRAARVWPLHLVVTVVCIARILINISGSQSIPLTPVNILSNLLMVQSWGWGTEPIAGNSWSVSTEVAAYLLYPLIAAVAFSRWVWVQGLAAVALLWLVARSGLGASGPMDVLASDSVLTLLRCLGGFALGVIAYRCARMRWARAAFDRPGAFALVCAAIAVALSLPGKQDLLVVCLMPALVLCCYYDGAAARALLANRLSFHLGLISYSIYLWHPLVRDIGARALTMAQRHGVTGVDALFLIGTVAATWLLCWASYHLIEVRGHRAIKWLYDGRRARAKAIGAAAW